MAGNGHWCKRCVLYPFCTKPQKGKELCWEFVPTHCDKRMRLAGQRLWHDRKNNRLLVLQQYICTDCNETLKVPKLPD